MHECGPFLFRKFVNKHSLFKSQKVMFIISLIKFRNKITADDIRNLSVSCTSSVSSKYPPNLLNSRLNYLCLSLSSASTLFLRSCNSASNLNLFSFASISDRNFRSSVHLFFLFSPVPQLSLFSFVLLSQLSF